jgi:hypothetical protein
MRSLNFWIYHRLHLLTREHRPGMRDIERENSDEDHPAV